MRKKTIQAIMLLWSTFAVAQTRYDSKNNFLLNDKPFFPFGCYGIFWENTLSDKLNSITEIGKAGLNIVCMDDIGETAAPGFTKVLDEAQKNKIQVLVGTTYAPNMKWRAIERKNHPATFGYTIADDADNGRFSLSELAIIDAEIKKEDPNHVTHLTLTGWDGSRRAAAKDYIAVSDFCSYQCYPIGHNKNADITVVKALAIAYERTLAYVKEAELQNKPFVHTPQTFTWGSQSDIPRYPTIVELRNMVYSALAAGVKGFISYDFSFDLVNNQKPLWKEYSDLGADVRGFKSILFDGTLTRHVTNDGDLVASTWKSADTTLITVVNTSYTAEKNVSITLSSPASGKLSSVSHRLATGLTISNGKIVGSIAPQVTYVYKLISNVITEVDIKSSNNAFSVFPNPASSELSIVGKIPDEASFEIISIDGRVLQTGLLVSQNIFVDNLTAGVYIFKMKSKNGTATQIFVKK